MKENMNAVPGEQVTVSPSADILMDEAIKLAPILRGMCEGGGADRDADIYAPGYSAPDGDVFVLRAADLLVEYPAHTATAVATERERAARLALQWSNARHPDHGGNALRAYAQALRDGVQVCEDESRDYHWSKAPTAPAAPLGEWAEAERISNLPAVHDVIQGFADDQTGDNAIMVVREVMRALPAPQQHAQAAQPKCFTCSGHGLIGGLMPGDGGYHSEDCPECDGRGFVHGEVEYHGDGMLQPPDPPSQSKCEVCDGSGKADPADAIVPAPVDSRLTGNAQAALSDEQILAQWEITKDSGNFHSIAIPTNAAILAFAHDLATRQRAPAPAVPWSFCPECGSEEIHHEEGDHKQCAACHQEWWADVDYTDVVREYLKERKAAPAAAAVAQGIDLSNLQLYRRSLDSMVEADASDGSGPALYFNAGDVQQLISVQPSADAAPGDEDERDMAVARAIRDAIFCTGNSCTTDDDLRRAMPTLAQRAGSEAKQQEPFHHYGLADEQLQQLLRACLKPEEISGADDVQHDRARELVWWFARLTQGNANSKWAVSHACELAYFVATNGINRHIDMKAVRDAAFKEGVNITPAERGTLERIGFANPQPDSGRDAALLDYIDGWIKKAAGRGFKWDSLPFQTDATARAQLAAMAAQQGEKGSAV